MDKIKRARIKELEEPDEFISRSQLALRYVIENKVRFMGAAGAVVAVLLIIAIVGYVGEKNENEAFLAHSRLAVRYSELVPVGGAAAAYQAVAADFEKFLQDHSGTVAGMLGRVRYADICFEGGDHGKAIPLYEEALSDFSQDPSLRNLILASLGHAHETGKAYEKAAGYFEEIAAGTGAIMKDEALFHLGLLYESLGKTEKSQEAFTRLLENHPDSIYLELVKEKVAG